jgi:hypothetical protein
MNTTDEVVRRISICAPGRHGRLVRISYLFKRDLWTEGNSAPDKALNTSRRGDKTRGKGVFFAYSLLCRNLRAFSR